MKITRILVMALIVSLFGVPAFAADGVVILETSNYEATRETMYEPVTNAVLFNQVRAVMKAYAPLKQELVTFRNTIKASEGLTSGAPDVKKVIQAIADEGPLLNKEVMDNLRMSFPVMGGFDAQSNNLTMQVPMVFEEDKFSGYMTIKFIPNESAICTTETSLSTAKIGVKQMAICVAHVGKYDSQEHYVFYKGYSTDTSATISFVRLPNMVARNDLNGWFEENHVPMAARLGIKNGADYQSEIAYTGGKVITTDPRIPDNYRGGSKKKR